MIDFKAGQIWSYHGKIKSFPKEMEVIQDGEILKERNKKIVKYPNLKLKALKKSGKYKEKNLEREEFDSDSPVNEIHSLVVIIKHTDDWKLKKDVDVN